MGPEIGLRPASAPAEPRRGRDDLVRRYGPVLPILALAFVVRWLFSAVLGPAFPYITFFPAVMAGGWIGGFGPGVCVTLGAALLSLGIDSIDGAPVDPVLGRRIGLALFLVSGVAMSLLAGRFHRLRRDAEDRALSLEKLAERLEMAQEAVSAGLWEWHVLDGSWSWTDATARLFGLPAGSPTRTELWRERIDPRDLPLFDDLWRRILGAEPPPEFDFRFRVVLPEGGGWRRTRGRVQVDAAGRAVRVLGLTLDIGDEVADETALRASEIRFDAILRSISALVYVKDLDGRLALVNPHYEEVFADAGRSPLGLDDRELFGEEAARQIRANDAMVLATGEAHRFEESARMPDGTLRTYVSVKVPLRGADGTIEGLCGVSTDITDLRRREEELRESQDRLRLAANVARLGFFDWDAAANRSRWSEELFELYGLRPRESGLDREEWLAFVHPDDRERAARAVDEALLADGYEGDFRVVRPDGETRWMHIRARVSRDGEGRPTGLYGANVDVTDRKLAEERVHESERLYRAIGESMDYGVWVCDATGRNVYASESMLRLTGMTQEECSGLGWTRVLHPEEVESTREAWARCVAGGEFWEREQRFLGTDGGWHHVLTRGIPIRDEAGVITAWAGINLDIEAFKRAQAALEEADRRKDEFLAMLSHELRNPLNAVVGATALLGRIGRGDEATARVVDVIGRQTRHLTRLLDDLLDVTRVTSGKIILKREPVRLDEIAAECVATFRIEGRTTGQEVVFVGDEPVWVSADRTRIEQVISNLLGNAVKYTPRDGTIRVAVSRHGEDAELEVSDTGAGLGADLLPRVFDLFVQGERTVDRTQGGLGIGLTLVKRITELHDGSVAASSDGAGLGSTFTVRLPALVRAPAATATPAPEPVARRRILVVEDHEDSRVTLRQLLELEGHEVREAADGRAGLALALEWRPDVALVDLGLPEMDGLELARAIRAADGPEPYLVALTGYGRPEDVRRARSAGFRAHLTKPFDPESLARTLAEAAGAPATETGPSSAARPASVPAASD